MVRLVSLCGHDLPRRRFAPRHRFAHTSADLADYQNPYVLSRYECLYAYFSKAIFRKQLQVV